MLLGNPLYTGHPGDGGKVEWVRQFGEDFLAVQTHSLPFVATYRDAHYREIKQRTKYVLSRKKVKIADNGLK